jgi:hypothetical protein
MRGYLPCDAGADDALAGAECAAEAAAAGAVCACGEEWPLWLDPEGE